MAKKEKGVGPYTTSDVSFLKRVPTKPFSMGRSIDTDVTRNAERTDGFSAKLDNPDKD
jgi:hypothetical protein